MAVLTRAARAPITPATREFLRAEREAGRVLCLLLSLASGAVGVVEVGAGAVIVPTAEGEHVQNEEVMESTYTRNIHLA